MLLLGVLVAIGLGYVAYGAIALGWFSDDPILITYRLEDPPQPRRSRQANVSPQVRNVVFGMDGKYVLTSIRVEQVAESEQGEMAGGVYVAPRTAPLWHMVADGDGSERTQRFNYGQPLRGMKSAIEGQPRAEPLQPDTPYRIIVEAGQRRAELEFSTTAVK